MYKVTTDVLSIDEAYAAVRRDDCGAVALFVGTVRDHHDGKAVKGLTYSAFTEMAEQEFAAIAAEAERRWKTGAVYIAHRTGAAFRHILANDFRGELHPVNPNAEFVGSRRAAARESSTT